MKTHFCIVIPSYNQAQFIEEAINSILTQQGDFTVTVIVRDGQSTDDTVDILKQFSSKIEWVSQPDNGQTDAINQGIEFFKKKMLSRHQSDQVIFGYLNSDDYYLPTAFQKVAQAFARHPQAQWVVGDARIVNEDGVDIQGLVRLYKYFWRRLLSWPLLLVLNPIPQPATFVRWSALTEVGLFTTQLRYVMDYDYWLRLYAEYGAPLVLPHTLAAFRIHQQSKGGSQFDAQFAEELHLAGKYSSNRLLWFFHWLHSQLIIAIYSLIK